MNSKYKTSILILFVSIAFIFSSSPILLGAEYESMKGVEAVKVVFDFRVGNPKVAAVHLDLIHKTYKDQNLMIRSKTPEMVVIFMGPAVKLVSKDRKGFSPEDQKQLDAIAGTLSNMAKDGVKLEICVAAVHLTGGNPDSILPEIKQVPNGWISAIGYHHSGYTLISDF